MLLRRLAYEDYYIAHWASKLRCAQRASSCSSGASHVFSYPVASENISSTNELSAEDDARFPIGPNFRIRWRRFLVKTTSNTRRGVAATMLSLLCAGLFALSLGGCAGEYYADTYYTPEYRYNTYYGPDYYPYYSYYGGAYSYGY